MADKGVSKAARELVSEGVHDVDEEILEKLRSLHPHEEPHVADAVAPECAWPMLTEDDDHLLREVVKAFSEASGGGPCPSI